MIDKYTKFTLDLHLIVTIYLYSFMCVERWYLWVSQKKKMVSVVLNKLESCPGVSPSFHDLVASLNYHHLFCLLGYIIASLVNGVCDTLIDI